MCVCILSFGQILLCTSVTKTVFERLKVKICAHRSSSCSSPVLSFDLTTFQRPPNCSYRASNILYNTQSFTSLSLDWHEKVPAPSSYTPPPPPSSCLILALESLPYSFWLFHVFEEIQNPLFFPPRRFLRILKPLRWHRRAAPAAAVSAMSRASRERSANSFLATFLLRSLELTS